MCTVKDFEDHNILYVMLNANPHVMYIRMIFPLLGMGGKGWYFRIFFRIHLCNQLKSRMGRMFSILLYYTPHKTSLPTGSAPVQRKSLLRSGVADPDHCLSDMDSDPNLP